MIAAVVAALLVAIAATFVGSRDELAQLRRISVFVLAATIAIQFVSQLFFNAAMLLPLQEYVAALGFWEFFLVRSGGVLAGSIVPVAGNLAVRLAYLRRFGLGYAEFAWATLVSNALALAASGALAVAATAAVWAVLGTPRLVVLVLAAVVLAVGAGAFAMFRLLPHLSGRLRLPGWRWAAAFSRFQAGRRTVAGVFWYSLGRHVCNFITFGLLYQALSPGPGDFLAGGLVYALSSPVRSVTLTPGNLGVIEWAVALVGRGLAFDMATGLIVALLSRVIALGAQGAGVLFAWAWLAAWGRA